MRLLDFGLLSQAVLITMIWRKLPSKFAISDVTIGLSYIEDCHSLKSNGPKKGIIKFVKRKHANYIRKNKNKLKGINISLIGINDLVFINDSLWSYYKML